MRRTKIVCTLGPATASPEMIRGLIDAGMDVARLNFSHGTPDDHRAALHEVRRAAEAAGRPVAILQDLAGPKLRIGRIAGGTVQILAGDRLALTTRDVAGDARQIPIEYEALPQEVRRGDRILLADGSVELEVEETTAEEIRCRVRAGGILTSRKGLNVPGLGVGQEAVTPKDLADLEIGLAEGVDAIALSFITSPEDVRRFKGRLRERGAADLPILGKIERLEAIQRIEEILSEVDGIIVARGDLGVEAPLERVPILQKRLIATAIAAGRPVITATQMLQSMVASPRPTRAEAADVANAVLDGTDAVMLSEETAMGSYPLEAVRILVRLIEATEIELVATRNWRSRPAARPSLIPEAIGRAACLVANDLQAKAIVTPTWSGASARRVAQHRPQAPILALSPRLATVKRLTWTWGVHPIQAREFAGVEEMIARAREAAVEQKLAAAGDTIVIAAGGPPGEEGSTNLIRAVTV